MSSQRGDRATRRTTVAVLAAVATVAAAGTAAAKPPQNLKVPKDAVVKYKTSGQWLKDQRAVAQRAQAQIRERADQFEMPALVLDIDDTSTSTYALTESTDFGFVGSISLPGELKANMPAIKPTLATYRVANQNDVSVFFITGRREGGALRRATGKNLRGQGYTEFERLYMRPQSDKRPSVIPFKSGRRKVIEQMGYTIVANMGDQHSDLRGGYAEATLKVPNPMYFIP
jgi:predicted secreted acid phosphatase